MRLMHYIFDRYRSRIRADKKWRENKEREGKMGEESTEVQEKNKRKVEDRRAKIRIS